MLIALLAILGVDLIVVLVVAVIVLGRKRWLKQQSGEFFGTARVSGGEIHGFNSRWKRGSGRWVRDVLVWSKGPFLYRDYLVPVDSVAEERAGRPGEVKRFGDEPVVIEFTSGAATIQVAAKAEHRGLVLGPMAAQSPTSSSS